MKKLMICVICFLCCVVLCSCSSKSAEKAYDNGYETGYAEGYENGLEAGRNAGYQGGYSDGWSEGYDAGLSTTQTYREASVSPNYYTSSPSDSYTVYVTNTGSKYHRAGCSYLKSSNAISLSDAIARGCTPCSRCNP